ncbi:MAG: DNA repair protein [Bacilli bacterium]|nr:DNA repair protein [Bacilli bacterium]
MEKVYMCIDLKSFFASVECVERGLDPLSTNLVVADPSRGNGAICLAVTPALKKLGVKNRCRIFEIPKNLNYIVALPRMKKYIDYSANIYSVYLHYVAAEDIHPYSIDEMFLDVTRYLKLYKIDKYELANRIMKHILKETGITSTVGIGTNLFLAKVALDLTAKHSKDNIGYLDEEIFKKTLWHHRPITDFWQVGKGIAKRLEKYGIVDMCGVATFDEKILYKEFGVNAEYLIDHSKGIEPTTISEIKKYKTKSNSISNGQVLFEDYPYDKARIVVKEMVDLLSLSLIEKKLVTNNVGLYIGYSKDVHKPTGGSLSLTNTTNVFSILNDAVMSIFDKTTVTDVPIRRINVSFGNVISEQLEQFDLFTDEEIIKKEKSIEQTINKIKKKYGKNSILRGMSLEDGATARIRNKLIGGHNSGEE